jgi:hypothetical protein
MMTRAEVLAFAMRDWEALGRSKAAHWMGIREELGAEEALEVADGLRAFVQGIRPDWPGDGERQADRAAHERVATVLSDAAKTWRS